MKGPAVERPSFPFPFVPSEVEGRRSGAQRVSTQFIQSNAAGGVEGLDTNGVCWD